MTSFRHLTQQRLGFHLPPPDVLEKRTAFVGTLTAVGRALEPGDEVWKLVDELLSYRDVPFFSYLPDMDALVKSVQAREVAEPERVAEKTWLAWIKDVVSHVMPPRTALLRAIANAETDLDEEELKKDIIRALHAEPFAVIAEGVVFFNWCVLFLLPPPPPLPLTTYFCHRTGPGRMTNGNCLCWKQ
jgi:hypothetical protein